MRTVLNIIAVLVLSAFALTGCEKQEALSPAQQEALKAYQQLPPGVRTALEAKDLRGMTFYVTTDDQAIKKQGFTRVCNEIVSQLLDNGAFRAEKANGATLGVAISSPTTGSVTGTGVHVTITDQHASVLLQGDFDGIDGGFESRENKISWQIRNLIKSLGVERRNKVLADAKVETTLRH